MSEGKAKIHVDCVSDCGECYRGVPDTSNKVMDDVSAGFLVIHTPCSAGAIGLLRTVQ